MLVTYLKANLFPKTFGNVFHTNYYDTENDIIKEYKEYKKKKKKGSIKEYKKKSDRNV